MRDEKASVTKTWSDAGHDGHGGQTRGCYGAVVTAIGARENAPGGSLGWICFLRVRVLGHGSHGGELQEKTVSTKKVVLQGKFELTSHVVMISCAI